MRVARGIGGDVAEVADVMFSCHRSAVVLMCGIEMSAGGRRIGRRAIALFVNVKAMFAWRQVLDVRDHLHFIPHFREGDCASNVATGLRF